MKKLVYLVSLILFSTSLNAQSQLKVKVLDTHNGETLPFSYITVISGVNNKVLLNSQTNEDGESSISVQFPCIVKATMLGYEVGKKTLYSQPKKNEIVFYLNKEFSSLNEVVVTGLSTPARQKDALSVHKVITRAQIDAQGAITLNEVMKNQLNVRVGNDNVLGSNLSVQGQGGDKVKILIDGLPLNGRENGNIDLSQINMNNVERIELIQGPMSVVYGTDAIGGVINIITKNENKPIGVNVGGFYESYGRYKTDISITKQINKKHQLTLGGGRNHFNGWKEIEQTTTYLNQVIYTSRRMLFKPKDQYFGNATYNYKSKNDFNLRFASDFGYDEVTNKGGLKRWDPYVASATDEYYRTTRSMNRLSLQGKIGTKGTWKSQNGYMIYNRKRISYDKDLVSLEQKLSTEEGAQDTSTFEDVFSRGSYSNNIGKLNYTLGYDINLQFAKSRKLNNSFKSIQDYAAYINLSLPLYQDKLTAQAGLRGSHNTEYNPPLIPSVNLLYKPKDNIQVRASFAKGYRAPSLKEMYLSFVDANHDLVGNENLQAEKSSHLQLSASYQAYEKKNDYLQFIVTGFYNDVYNGITLAQINPEDPNSLEYTYANVAQQQNSIVSLQTDGQLSNFHYQVGYSYTYTFENDQTKAFDATQATATLQYAWRKTGMNFNVIYKYHGRQQFLQANITGSTEYNGIQKAYSLCDFSIEKKLFEKRVQIMAGVKNVFDIQRPSVSGQTSLGTHGGSSASFLPRSIFTSLRLSLN